MKQLLFLLGIALLASGVASAQAVSEPADLQQQLQDAHRAMGEMALQIQRLHNELDSDRCGHGVLKK